MKLTHPTATLIVTVNVTVTFNMVAESQSWETVAMMNSSDQFGFAVSFHSTSIIIISCILLIFCFSFLSVIIFFYMCFFLAKTTVTILTIICFFFSCSSQTLNLSLSLSLYLSLSILSTLRFLFFHILAKEKRQTLKYS